MSKYFPLEESVESPGPVSQGGAELGTANEELHLSLWEPLPAWLGLGGRAWALKVVTFVATLGISHGIFFSTIPQSSLSPY